MNVEGTLGQEAEGKLMIAEKRLVRRYPFHARFVARWTVRCASWLETMGVRVDGDRVLLFCNPHFVRRCSLPEVGGVLLHEVHHVLFGHIFADPKDYPDEHARTIAEEVTVNEWIAEPLPGHPILLQQFPDLPPDEDTDTRYRRLSQSSRSTEQDTARGRKPEAPPRDHGPDKSEKNTERLLETLDDHSLWSGRGEFIERLSVAGLIHDVSRKLPAEEWAQCSDALRRQVRTAARGWHCGNELEHLDQNESATLNWRAILRRYVGQVLIRRPVFNRPPRRFPELLGIVPGRGRSGGRPRILAAIDTSASMSPEQLDAISAELHSFARDHEVVVAETDARIQAVYRYDSPIRSVRGRGGTDFRPALSREFLAQHRPGVVIYFTDGHGPAPARKPAVPVVWCLTEFGQRPAPWGREIRVASPRSSVGRGFPRVYDCIGAMHTGAVPTLRNNNA